MSTAVEPVYVVVPVYNEPGIRSLVDALARHVDRERVVLVDDGSRPAIDRAALAPSHVLRHLINLGKGAALRTGCEFAVRRGAGAIVLMDGDGQHDPSDLPRLLAPLADADIVFADRRMGWRVPWVRLLGNRVVNLSTQLLYGARFRDIWCGYRAFRAEVFQQLVWESPDYAADVEMALRAVGHGLRRSHIEIDAIYHDAHKGVTVADGLRLLLRMVSWRVNL